ncbi:hypothetical protein J6590_072424 [Homalodisca vitripennis]|nr:hypothetical protein J6590_072424 [Homalodisca vitripennis]
MVVPPTIFTVLKYEGLKSIVAQDGEKSFVLPVHHDLVRVRKLSTLPPHPQTQGSFINEPLINEGLKSFLAQSGVEDSVLPVQHGFARVRTRCERYVCKVVC